MSTPWENRLGLRLLLWVLLISAVLSLLATTVQLYLNFQRQDEALQAVTGQIEQGFGKRKKKIK